MLIGAAVLFLVLMLISQVVLNGFYARSLYPVPYYTGQLSFSATSLEGWYGFMQGAGTLDIYWRTQFVDFGFIVGTFLVHFSSLVLVARLLPAGRWRTFGARMVLIGLLAPTFDVLENLVSFVNLQSPLDISQPMALLYSSMAALKFAGFAVVYSWIVVGLIVALIKSRSPRRVVS